MCCCGSWWKRKLQRLLPTRPRTKKVRGKMREVKLNKVLVQERAPFPIAQSKGKTKTNMGSPIKNLMRLQKNLRGRK
jgi:hypothetical protein